MSVSSLPQHCRTSEPIFNASPRCYRSKSLLGWSLLGWLSRGILQQAPQCPKRVLQSNLLAFLISSPGIADPHFVNSQLSFGDLHRDLRFESEARLLQRDRLQRLTPEGLITGFHVRKIQIRKTVREQRQQFVTHGMPKVEHPVRSASHKPRPKNHIRLALNERSQQGGVFRWIVLQVGILNN